MKSWRKFTWLILVVQVLFIVWIVTGVSSVSDSCSGLTGTDLDVCQAGTAIGAGIGVGLILVLWAVVDVILLVVWLVTGRNGRDCPVCGRSVKKGRTKCDSCGHDFAAAAAK